jgi:hypothetical protein
VLVSSQQSVAGEARQDGDTCLTTSMAGHTAPQYVSLPLHPHTDHPVYFPARQTCAYVPTVIRHLPLCKLHTHGCDS